MLRRNIKTDMTRSKAEESDMMEGPYIRKQLARLPVRAEEVGVRVTAPHCRVREKWV